MILEINPIDIELGPIDLLSPIDRSHPCASGILSWQKVIPQWSGGANTWFDLAGTKHGTLTSMSTGSNGWSALAPPGSYGSLQFDGSAGYIAVPAPGISSTNTFTMLCRWYSTQVAASRATYGGIMCYRGTKTISLHYGLAGSESKLAHTWNDNATGHNDTSGPTVPANSWVCIGFSVGPSSSLVFQYEYATGTWATRTISVTNSAIALADAGRLGDDSINNFPGPRYTAGYMDDAITIQRTLTESEAFALVQELGAGCPGLLRREPAWWFRKPSTANAYTLTAAQGSFSLSGQAAGLRANRLLSAGQGSFTQSGQAAGLRVGRKITAGQGSFALTGQSANLLRTTILTCSAGSFSLSGQAAILKVNRLISAGQGTFTFTGQAAGLVHGTPGAYTLTAAYGAFTLSGQSVGLIAARHIAAGQGAFTFTGQAAGLRVERRLAAACGAFTVAGQSASLLWSGEVVGATINAPARFPAAFVAAGAARQSTVNAGAAQRVSVP